MAYEWKAGDRAMVEIGHRDAKDKWCMTPTGYWLPIDILHPLPAPDAHQALRDAVVEAALEAFEKGVPVPEYLGDALMSLRAALTPPDPVEELREAWETLPVGLLDEKHDPTIRRISEAIAALEAARKVGK
jgi:hypothetical protein